MERKRHIVSCVLGVCIAFGVMGCGKRALEEKDFCHLVLEEGLMNCNGLNECH